MQYVLCMFKQKLSNSVVNCSGLRQHMCTVRARKYHNDGADQSSFKNTSGLSKSQRQTSNFYQCQFFMDKRNCISTERFELQSQCSECPTLIDKKEGLKHWLNNSAIFLSIMGNFFRVMMASLKNKLMTMRKSALNMLNKMCPYQIVKIACSNHK